ncbi:tyrosine-type recombinase/integrase [Roseovarius indicus]|uniref:Site-specific tyrosine recombinase XerC n=1 Tax=Roseovarius indicus TaxID=540747 RepID=A0A0T5P6Q6_9RHOB|nr:tyrosine-type recombinase/integrase [Roseovarius indicus]KRS16919.1 hypothetical protein XM52_15145 [Roseovarius indicus]QEW29561.1 site-specific tyrosine recombinase XerC [Roseovarius indicus]SFE47591.1 Phage integrase family protein [Roseovarius indicus]
MQIETLQHVYQLLPDLYSETSRDAYRAAFRRAERLTNKKLWQLAADERAWEQELSKIVWAGEFRAKTPEAAERAFETWGGKIPAAIRRARKHVGSGPATNRDAKQAWDRIADYVSDVENCVDETGQRILPNMSGLSIANLRARLGHMRPQTVDTEGAIEALRKLPADKTESYRNAVRFFNRLIREQNRHAPIADLLPDRQVGELPTRRDAPLDWSRFSQEFLDARDTALDQAVQVEANKKSSRAARIAARRQNKRLRRRRVFNPDATRKNYVRSLSWLARHAEEDRGNVYDVKTLDDLVTEDRVEAAVKRYIARGQSDEELRDTTQTSSVKSYLSALLSLARRNGMPEDLVFALEDIADDPDYVSDRDGEMSATREEFIRLVDRDPAIVRAIVTGPETLLREARRGFDRWERLSDAQKAETLHLSIAAAAMAVQLARPLRTRNVNEFDAGGQGTDLVAPRRAGAKAWIEIDRSKVKNRRAIEGPVPDWLWAVFEAWQEEGRSRWIARHKKTGCRDTDALFPGTRGGYLTRSTFNKCWNRGMSRLGLTGLTPHTMRHVAATLYLAVHPGDYHVVAALLCDELKTVEHFYARGEGRAAAELFAQVLEDLHPTLGLRGNA